MDFKRKKQLIQEVKERVYAQSHEYRFRRQIYLYYVEMNEVVTFVNKEQFKHEVINKADRVKNVEYTNQPFDIADEKQIWLSKEGRILGEVWKEQWENEPQSVVYVVRGRL